MSAVIPGGVLCGYKEDLLSSGSLRNRHGNTKNGVGAQLCLVRRAIELVEEFIDLCLFLDVQILLDQSGSNGVVDVGDGLGNTCT